ncbi:Uma2 family endonuclease [Streptomyces seoulensis]|uniref:Uma2 family endonuclease n=1 Tax=Streptomyces seoulensis TaxID=73044 RepID=UPI001FCC30E4|nr:Uma2 family endonuclease [Streptomyces seoulensis]BDH08172.1 hypothetical protein HEK131_53990 [Streptomyces seoulensis]
MSAFTVSQDPDRTWDDLVRFWDESDWPEGSRVEIIEGIVTVSPTPENQHNSIVELVQSRLYRDIPDGWGIYQTQSLAVPSRLGMFIPDLVVAPRSVVRAPGNYIPAAAADLVVEVTSKSNARHDRVGKPAAYASAGIPYYLLIDRWAQGGPTITLYGEPQRDVYRVLHAGKFGDEFLLPEPFNLRLDTSEFPVD